jgi:hypothetical protein
MYRTLNLRRIDPPATTGGTDLLLPEVDTSSRLALFCRLLKVNKKRRLLARNAQIRNAQIDPHSDGQDISN